MGLFTVMKLLLSSSFGKQPPTAIRVMTTLTLSTIYLTRCDRFIADLKRSRDPAILDTCDIVVDVGAIYDESKQRFDHHQRGFTEVFGHGFETKLSSAGLVYK